MVMCSGYRCIVFADLVQDPANMNVEAPWQTGDRSQRLDGWPSDHIGSLARSTHRWGPAKMGSPAKSLFVSCALWH